MRRLLTVVIVAALTTVGSMYWLHDGDLQQVAELYTPEWDAELLAQNAGIVVHTAEPVAEDEPTAEP